MTSPAHSHNSQGSAPSAAALAAALSSPQVGYWPERKKNVAAESGRFVAIQSRGPPPSPRPVISGMVVGYCVAEAYDRRALYKYLRKRYKKRGKVVMHPDAICLQLHSDEPIVLKGLQQTDSNGSGSEPLHIPNNFLGDLSMDGSPGSYNSMNSPPSSESRYGTFDAHDLPGDWHDYQPPPADQAWGVKRRKSADLGYTQTIPKEIYFFDYGVAVCWGLSSEQQQKILKEMQEFEIGRLAAEDIDVDSFEVIVDTSALQNIRDDTITLDSIKRDNMRLAISLAVSQSTKLGVQEDMVHSTVDRYRHLAETLASTGSFDMSRPETNMVIGELYTLISSVNLSSNVLDLPDFFWVHSDDTAQTLYNALRTYLQISRRLKVVGRRIDILSSIVAYLKGELNATSLHRLDWLIIIVLAIDATCQLLFLYMKLVWDDEDIIG